MLSGTGRLYVPYPWPAALERCARCDRPLGPRAESLFWCQYACMEHWQFEHLQLVEPDWDPHRRLININQRMATATAVVAQALPWMDARASS